MILKFKGTIKRRLISDFVEMSGARKCNSSVECVPLDHRHHALLLQAVKSGRIKALVEIED